MFQTFCIKNVQISFLKNHFIFIENDSTDNTKEILEKWYKNKNCSSTNMDGLKNIPKRGLRLEAARNTYLKIIKDSNNLKKYDYLIVMDFDDASIFEIEKKNLLKSFLKIIFPFKSLRQKIRQQK